MPKTFRIRTTPGKDQNLHLNIEQDFDQLEILSLKLTQDDVYSKMCADYGVIVGRIFANGGFGIPNVKVSVFIPLEDIDENNPILNEKYPFKSIDDTTNDNLRYNLLPRERQHCGHTEVGSFPSIEEVLVNDQELDVYKKYYKFTVKTNDSGDYMIWGAPLGVYNLHMDLDLSDMGCYSLTPMDFILQGVAVEEFVSETEYDANENLDKLPQIVKQRKSVDIVPFWGDDELCSIGITRVDFDLRDSGVEITPHAVLLGSSFTDAGTRAVTKRCRPRLKQGVLCDLKTSPGKIDTIRMMPQVDDNNDPVLEKWKPPSTEQPGGSGAFLTHLPMNLDYITTDEFGNQVVSQDPSNGVATSGKYRLRVSPVNESGSGRQRIVGSYLIPNIRQMGNPADDAETHAWSQPSYAFSSDWRDYEYPNINGAWAGVAPGPPVNNNYTAIKDMAIACEDYFYHYKANRVYTVSSFMDKIKKTGHRRGFLGIKNIEPTEDAACGASANYFPITSAYKVVNFMIVIMQIITRLQQIIYTIFIGIISVIILPFEKLGKWQVFKGTPFKWLINLVVCPLKNAGRIELEAVAYPECEKCACDEEEVGTGTPASTNAVTWGSHDGSNAASNPNDPGSICDVNWWYGGQAGTFYITRMECKSVLINSGCGPGAVPPSVCDNEGGIFENPPNLGGLQGQGDAYDSTGGLGTTGLGFRITSVDIGAGNISPTASNTYAGGDDFPNWCNGGNGPCANPPAQWCAKITSATLNTGKQPADITTETGTMSIAGTSSGALDAIYQAVGAATGCTATAPGGIVYPTNGLNAINLCGSLFKGVPGDFTSQANPEGMCNSAAYINGTTLQGYVYAGDALNNPSFPTSQFFENTGTAPWTYAFGDFGGNDGGNNGPGGASICDLMGSGEPYPFYITTNQINGAYIEDGMNADTSGKGQIVPNLMGIIFTITTSSVAGTQIDANNSDDCDAYGNYYDDPSCDCTTQAGIGGCESICDVACTGSQCSAGDYMLGAQTCRKSCYGDPGCGSKFGCLSSYSAGGCYVIYPSGSSTDRNKAYAQIAEWRNVTNINSALCNGLMGYFFTNQWINGTLYHFQFKGKEKGSFWSGPGCRQTQSGVVKFHEKEGKNYWGKWGSGANRKKWYYRSTQFDVSTVATGGNGFYYSGSIFNTSYSSNGSNKNYIKFPTTVVDVGPRVSWLKTICANPDLDAECFTADDLGASTHQSAAPVLQVATNQRLGAGCGDGDLGDIFFNREQYRLDGDISQALTEQGTVGVQEFDLNDPDYGLTIIDVVTNVGTSGPPTKISFLLGESGANSRSCIRTPYELYDWDPLDLKWVPENLGKQTQIVPFYPWNRWAGGCGWDGYSELWGGCGPQNNGSQWTKGVGQDWHSDADNGGFMYADYYQGLGNNYSQILTNFGPGNTPGPNNQNGDGTFRQNSPDPSFFSGNTYASERTFMVLGAPYHFYMGLTPGDNAYSYFKQKYINDDDCNPDDFI
tara:strand:+ start:69354 stop:73814 length:4461 start_codon:yes stop_codon:yes gene_type:complete